MKKSKKQVATEKAAIANSNQRRKRKRSRKEKQAEPADERINKLIKITTGSSPSKEKKNTIPDDVSVEYVEQEQPQLEDTEFAEYASVFSQFANNAVKSFGIANQEENKADEQTKSATTEKINGESTNDVDMLSAPSDSGDDSDNDSNGLVSADKLSRKQKKKARMSIAELKQQASRPEVVEWTDVSAQDPGLLVAIKAIRNTVPVPKHWSQKKKYLQYKRGTEKPPFELPDFIRATGITEMREAIKDKEDEKKTKTTARDRMRPKMNKLTLDYQRLHDAFFRLQTPYKKLTGHGDMFYEGKESEVAYNFTPGVLSDTLKSALNIPDLAPPPWLLNMQRYGPPPSYPSQAIPGLNAPIPAGAQWGYHPGGWGRPPVDEFGRPLYGDVFAAPGDTNPLLNNMSVDAGPKKYWGDLEVIDLPEYEGEQMEEDVDNEKEEEEVDQQERMEDDGVDEKEEVVEIKQQLTKDQLRSGLASMPSGLETPSVLPPHKQTTTSEANRPLYTILPEQGTTQLQGIIGSQYTYDMSQAIDPSKKRDKGGIGTGVQVALDASELEGLDQETLQAKYEQANANAANTHEDLSDMVAEHAVSKSRRKPKASGSKKKAKDFKF